MCCLLSGKGIKTMPILKEFYMSLTLQGVLPLLVFLCNAFADVVHLQILLSEVLLVKNTTSGKGGSCTHLSPILRKFDCDLKTIGYVKEKLFFLSSHVRVFAPDYPARFCSIDDIVKRLESTDVQRKGQHGGQ
jgi:hypothetical protein